MHNSKSLLKLWFTGLPQFYNVFRHTKLCSCLINASMSAFYAFGIYRLVES